MLQAIQYAGYFLVGIVLGGLIMGAVAIVTAMVS